MSTLLKVIDSTTTPVDDFVQRIAIHLLNALSCQVDYSDKRLVGLLGAFPVIFSVHCAPDKVSYYKWTHFVREECYV